MPTMTLVSKKIQWNKYYSLKDLLDWKHASVKYTMIRYSRGKTIFFTQGRRFKSMPLHLLTFIKSDTFVFVYGFIYTCIEMFGLL